MGPTVTSFLALLLSATAGDGRNLNPVPEDPGKGTISGIVRDKDTGQPIAGVTVVAQGPQGELAEVTDDRGDYTITDVPAGKYLVVFFTPGGNAPKLKKEAQVGGLTTVRVNARITLREEEANKAPSASSGNVSTGGCGRPTWRGPIDAWESEPEYFTAQHVIYYRAYTRRMPLR